MAGDTGIPCMVNDQPIYRDTIYTENLSDTDITLEHDNGEQIREAKRNNISVRPGMTLGDNNLV